MVIQIVSAELQSSAARRASPNDQLTLLVTALLALNLAAITGVRLSIVYEGCELVF